MAELAAGIERNVIHDPDDNLHPGSEQRHDRIRDPVLELGHPSVRRDDLEDDVSGLVLEQLTLTDPGLRRRLEALQNLVGMDGPPIGEREVVDHPSPDRADHREGLPARASVCAARDEIGQAIADQRHRVRVQVGGDDLAFLTGQCRLPVVQHLDDHSIITGVDSPGGLAFPSEERELVRGIGLQRRDAERFGKPPAHERRQHLATDHQNARTDAALSRREQVIGDAGEHARQSGDEIGSERLELLGDRLGILHAVDAERRMHPHRAQPAAHHLRVLRMRRTRIGHRGDPSAQAEPERLVGPLAEQGVKSVLEPRAPDDERLAGRSVGPDRE